MKYLLLRFIRVVYLSEETADETTKNTVEEYIDAWEELEFIETTIDDVSIVSTFMIGEFHSTYRISDRDYMKLKLYNQLPPKGGSTQNLPYSYYEVEDE